MLLLSRITRSVIAVVIAEVTSTRNARSQSNPALFSLGTAVDAVMRGVMLLINVSSANEIDEKTILCDANLSGVTALGLSFAALPLLAAVDAACCRVRSCCCMTCS